MAALVYTPEKQAVLDRLLFSPGPHLYTLDGMRLTSPTKVLEPYLPYGGLPKDVREAALQRGTLVHALTELEDLGKLDDDDIQLAEAGGLMPFLAAYRQFKRDFPLKVIETEFRVYHSRYRYSGTGDRLYEATQDIDMGKGCVIPAGFPILGEIKTGSHSPYYALQTAAYVGAIEDGGISVPYRWCIVLKQSGKYELFRHENRDDFPAFLGALKMAEWRSRYDRNG